MSDMDFQAKRDRLKNLYETVTKDRNELFKISQMPIRTFRRCYIILDSGGSISRKAGSGRPPILDGSDRRKLCGIALTCPMFSAANVKQKFTETSGKTVSTSTVQRNLKMSGILKKLPKIVPDITPIHEEKRRKFTSDWKHYHFHDVFMTDESLFQLYRNKIQFWSSKRGKIPVKKQPKFCPKIMVWGALSYRGFYLKIIDGPGTINSQKYCHIIDEFIPYADCLYQDSWILEQDGATPHTSNFTKDFFNFNNVQLLQWPPNSPDLTPIENVWQILKDYVEKKNPKNVQELKRFILESQHLITQSIRVHLIDSTSKRLCACHENGGKLVG